ncbi:MAG: nucleoside triphosphate pyrophosphohydrolase [Myxococcota bacterium]|nr:nucleoside triphosphate pyrophosphohydrolase [Myxococcota bacterium]
MPTPGEQFEALIAIMDRLRDPGGCPWDQKQTMESLQPYLIEEAYECLDAMERGDRDEQCDELGDLLLQIVFQSRIASEDGSFTLSDVIQAISDKMIRRHPHVFSDGSAEDAEDVLTQWEEIKRREKGDQPRSIVAGIPVSAPALQRAARLGEKVSRVGLDWDSAAAVREKVNEELGELEEAAQRGDAAQIEEELGDLLFTVAQLARHLKVEPEGALRKATRKFTQRIEHIEASLDQADQTWEQVDDVERLWDEAKSS